MEKNTYLESINFHSINVIIAMISGLITVVLALAPITISGLLRLEYTIQSTGSWFNSSRIVWITSLSITLLALWARYIQEIYAQKILLKSYRKKLCKKITININPKCIVGSRDNLRILK